MGRNLTKINKLRSLLNKSRGSQFRKEGPIFLVKKKKPSQAKKQEKGKVLMSDTT
jgi:hypothetical protein